MPSIPCPQCKTNIEFNVHDIFSEKHFTCLNCNVNISLSYQENKDILKNAHEQLEALKDELDID